MFHGLSANIVWQVENAYKSGDPFLLFAAADSVKKAGGDGGLVLQIQTDAKRAGAPSL
jgi:hypothetical protein